jgi:hypothetical protein
MGEIYMTLDILAYIIVALTIIFIGLPILGSACSNEDDYFPCMKVGIMVVALFSALASIIWAFSRVF